MTCTPMPFTLAFSSGSLSTQGTAYSQLVSRAVDVSSFDFVDLMLFVFFHAPTTPTITVDIITAPQAHSSDGWVIANSFPAVTSQTNNTAVLKGVTGLQRYIRWQVQANNFSGLTSVRFRIEGVGRRYSGA